MMGRFLICLALAALALVGYQNYYYRGQGKKLYNEAVGYLPLYPDQAYKKFEPVFGYGKAQSIGFKKQYENKFLNELELSATQLIKSREKLGPDFIRRVREHINILKQIEEEHEVSTEEQRQEIVIVLARHERALSESIGIVAWDAFIANAEKMVNEGLIEGDANAEMRDALVKMKARDRSAIAYRDAMEEAKASLKNALEVVGLSGAPALIELPANISDSKKIEADKLLGAGQGQLTRFKTTFSPNAPLSKEMRLMFAKLELNHAALRMADMVEQGDRLYEDPSYYMMDRIGVPSSGEMASGPEVVGSMINFTRDQLRRALQVFGEYQNEPMGEIHYTVAVWTVIYFKQNVPSTAAPDQALMSTLRTQAGRIRNAPSGGTALKLMETAKHPIWFGI